MLVQTKMNNFLKIVFTQNEALRIFGSNKPDLRDTKVQNILNNLFKKISKQVNFKAGSNKLMVELTPAFSGGFLLSFKSSEENLEITAVMEFDSLDSLLQAINILKKEKQLYLFQGKYRIIYKTNNDTLLHISEYCSKIYTASTEIAKTREYGKLINC